jgi:hypothetical protein
MAGSQRASGDCGRSWIAGERQRFASREPDSRAPRIVMPGRRSKGPVDQRARRSCPAPDLGVNRERASDGEGDERRRRESNPLPRFCRPPPGRQAPAPCVLRPSPGGPCPRQESNLVSDLRKVVCASVTPRGLRSKRDRSRAPHPGIEPGLAASKAAVRPPHPRGNSRVPSPGVEPGPRPSESRVPSVTRRGRDRSRRPDSNRHEPAYKAGASPFGHVGGKQGRKESNPVREFWRLAALPGAHP